MQRTLSILKPDITRRNLTGAVNERIEVSGLKIIAQNDIKTFDDFMNLELKNLKLEEIKEQKLKTEIVYSII